MKKHNMMRVASAMAVVTLLSTGLISGTLAKYTSTKAASDTATVAKWAFTVGGKDIAKQDFEFKLFNTINDTGNTEAETDVTGSKVIAPGTSGQVQLVLKNDSEVTAKYSVSFEEAESGATRIPLQYAIKKNSDTQTEWTDNLASLNQTVESVAVNAVADTYTLYWKWDYDTTTNDGANDVRDTGLGTAESLATQTIKATVTATQVD